ncbi:hypothetical protein HYC85_018420 [Camellia sinensis]|uniref:Uncharacterized protein n=1 Tax=Camellia sinensis TaxID=4442 RepID=A0A7J7GU90_CAMSI|nr:hypothetical protein HYC85_018420 [Camellia sinensis]
MKLKNVQKQDYIYQERKAVFCNPIEWPCGKYTTLLKIITTNDLWEGHHHYLEDYS